MRRPLFWKILFGFWVTIILITQALWLLLAVPESPLEIRNDAADVEHFAVAIAASSIAKGGLAGLEADLTHWPPSLREGLSIDKDVRTMASPGGIEEVVTDPSGVTHHVGYRAISHAFFQRPKYIFLSVLGGLIFSAILAWYLTTPILKIRVGFEKLAHGDFSIRLGPGLAKRRDEIADLADDFDSMADHLQKLIRERDQLLATLSHEVRSPLARLRLAIGLAQQDREMTQVYFQRIEGEVMHLDRLVGEVLTLCRMESGIQKIDEYFDLVPLLESISADAAFEAKPREIAIAFQAKLAAGSSERLCRGSSQLIHSAVENVVRNAVRHSPTGQQVQISLQDEPADCVRITIRDKGPGISEEMLDTVLEPFRKCDNGGDGFGLGLAIAHRAVQAHGGSLRVQNAEDCGLIATITLPRAAA